MERGNVQQESSLAAGEALLNRAFTAPYMHHGSIARLEDVIEFYAKGCNPNLFLDSEIKPLKLTSTEKADIITFLRSLGSVEFGFRRVKSNQENSDRGE